MLDAIDREILELLKTNAKASLREISKEVKLSIPAVSERIRKLEQKKIIKQYTIILNDAVQDDQCVFFCLLTLKSGDDHSDKYLAEQISQHREIVEFHRILGAYEYIMKVQVDSPRELERIISELRKNIKINKSISYTVLSSLI